VRVGLKRNVLDEEQPGRCEKVEDSRGEGRILGRQSVREEEQNEAGQNFDR
jgi:hypothetical protein